jgi:hypothetical protein
MLYTGLLVLLIYPLVRYRRAMGEARVWITVGIGLVNLIWLWHLVFSNLRERKNRRP